MADMGVTMMEGGKARLSLKDYRPLLDRLLGRMRGRLGDRLLAVALFGSAARGEAGPYSDLDLLIVHQGDRKEVHATFVDLVLELRHTTEYQELSRQGILAEPYPLFVSREKLANTPWILLDIVDHGILLYDPAGILEARLKALRTRLQELGTQKIVLGDGTWYWKLKPDWKPGEVIEL